MSWFFKVTYEGGVPCAEAWLGPFVDEQTALDRKSEVEAKAASLGRSDACSAPEDIADPRPSPVTMIVSRWNGETEQYEDWEIHEDGTENKRAA